MDGALVGGLGLGRRQLAEELPIAGASLPSAGQIPTSTGPRSHRVANDALPCWSRAYIAATYRWCRIPGGLRLVITRVPCGFLPLAFWRFETCPWR